MALIKSISNSIPLFPISLKQLIILSSLIIASYPKTAYGQCNPSGQLQGSDGNCNTDNGAECCQAGQSYPQYQCSPPVSGDTLATMTINSFEQGGDGGGPSSCDGNYHSNNEPVVALSTGWFDGRSRCNNNIKISANGKSVLARVADECDSVNGCDAEHDYQPPCRNNIVDASRAVWDELGIPESQIGEFQITWADA